MPELHAQISNFYSILDAAFACKQLKVLELYDAGAFNIPNLVIKTFPPNLEIFKANFRVDLQLEYGDKPFKLQIFENTLFTLENLPETGAAVSFPLADVLA